MSGPDPATTEWVPLSGGGGAGLPTGGANGDLLVKDSTDPTYGAEWVTPPAAGPSYTEGSWTPAISFETPGNVAVTYSLQLGRYIKIGNMVTVWGCVIAPTFTHTTAGGDLQITGLPFPASNISTFFQVGSLQFDGVTKAGYTQFVVQVEANRSHVRIMGCGSGQGNSAVSPANAPSGSAKGFYLQLTYRTN